MTKSGEGSHAARHRQVRAAHSSEIAEDYVEAIADIIDKKKDCRVVDLTRRFGVSHVTVSRTVGRLVRDGLAKTAPYEPIRLTPAGRRLARRSRARHETIVDFLLSMGVDATTAQADAEGIEHHVSPKTLAAFGRYLKKQGK